MKAAFFVLEGVISKIKLHAFLITGPADIPVLS